MLREVARSLTQTSGGRTALALLSVIALAAFLGPVVAPSPLEQNLASRLSPPGAQHIMGTDHLGRDVFSRVLHGTRASLGVALTVALLSGLGGGLLGLLSGYAGGLPDLLMQRVVDALMAVPLLVLALTLLAVADPSQLSVAAVLAVAFAPITVRVARSSALAMRNAGWIEAARACGVPGWRVLTVHMLPNAAGPWIIVVAGQVGAAVLAESSLSFLGLGVTEPRPSLGGMLGGHAQTALHTAPWLVVWPGLVIALLVLAANLLGDAVADALGHRVPRTQAAASAGEAAFGAHAVIRLPEGVETRTRSG